MFDLFDFGAKKTRPRRKSPVRRRRSPRHSPSPRRKSPIRRRRSTVRKCNNKITLSKLRKLAMENGINIFSEARTSISKKTGQPKKPKMVGCSTLMKRMNEAGLGHLYKVRMDKVTPSDMFEEEQLVDSQIFDSPMYGPCGIDEIRRDNKCISVDKLDEKECVGPDIKWVVMGSGGRGLCRPARYYKNYDDDENDVVDPNCDNEFKKFLKSNPKMKNVYSGYAMGEGPCSSRAFVELPGSDLQDYSDVKGFDMSYGRRVMAGARPKMTQKPIGEIVVKGRKHMVFKGLKGGLYYMKGKKGRKIYITQSRIN